MQLPGRRSTTLAVDVHIKESDWTQADSGRDKLQVAIPGVRSSYESLVDDVINAKDVVYVSAVEVPLRQETIWKVASPRLLLRKLCGHCEPFRRVWKTPGLGNSIILCVDEFTPGDLLHPETCRETVGFYFAIK